jgi:hypothetical protein
MGRWPQFGNRLVGLLSVPGLACVRVLPYVRCVHMSDLTRRDSALARSPHRHTRPLPELTRVSSINTPCEAHSFLPLLGTQLCQLLAALLLHDSTAVLLLPLLLPLSSRLCHCLPQPPARLQRRNFSDVSAVVAVAAAAAAAAANTCQPYFPPTATSETSATRFGPATNCDSPCVNTSTDPPGSCGGALANSLYRLPPQPEGGVSPPPPPPAGGGGAPAPPAVIPVPTTTLNVTALGKLI